MIVVTEVPPPRVPLDTTLWATDAVCAVIATTRGITPESARRRFTRWLSDHPEHIPHSRQPGRDGQNLYRATTVRAVLNTD